MPLNFFLLIASRDSDHHGGHHGRGAGLWRLAEPLLHLLVLNVGSNVALGSKENYVELEEEERDEKSEFPGGIAHLRCEQTRHCDTRR